MAYPTRVTWQFRNVSQDEDFWPLLDSIEIQDTNQQDVATFSCEVVDPDLAITIEDEDEVWVKADGVKVFGGRIKTLTTAYRSEVGPRTYQLEAQDFTARLDDSVIDHPKSRATESADDRLAWILTFLNFSITTGGVNLPAEDAEKGDFDGMTVREALDSLADELRLSYYVDYEKDLHMFRTETVTAPFLLDNDAPDYATAFPFREWDGETQDSVELANATLVMGDKRRAWVESAGSIATWGRQERSLQDSELVTTSQIQNAGLRANAENDQPVIEGHFVCHEPGLQAGMTIHLTAAEWPDITDAVRILTEVSITAVDPLDDEGLAYLRTEVTYSDRRRARPYRHPRHPKHPDVEDGDPITFSRYAYQYRVGRLGLAAAFHYESIPDDYQFAGPGGPIHREVTQNSHPHNIPWTAGVCALGLGGWGGYAIEEVWWGFNPGDLLGTVGIRVTVELDNEEGFRTDLMVGIATDPPTPYVQRDFTEFTRIPAQPGTVTFVVPASVLTPSADQFLCFAAAWDAQGTPGSWVCINEESGIGDVVGNGLYMSGQIRVNDCDGTELLLAGGGVTSWVSGKEQADGSNRVWTLVDWNGKGIPEARIGAVVQGHPLDYDYDDEAGTVTFQTAPAEGSVVGFRYHI